VFAASLTFTVKLLCCSGYVFVATALHAVADWLRGCYGRFIWLSACVVIVFRAELAILLGLFALQSVIQRRLTFSRALANAVPSALVCLGQFYGFTVSDVASSNIVTK